MDVRALFRPIVRWLVNLFMTNLEKFVEEVVEQLIEVLQSDKVDEHLDAIKNPLYKAVAAAMLDAIREYIKDADIKEFIDFN